MSQIEGLSDMKSKNSKPARDGKDCIILAIPPGEDRFGASAVIRKMDIPLCVVNEMFEVEEALSNNSGALGVIAAQELLGNDAAKALERIKSIDSELPVVVVASDTNIAFEKTMRHVGIFYYLLSPYDREEFLNVVHSLHSHHVRRNKVSGVIRSNRNLAKGATQ